MIYRKLGTTGLSVSEIGLGCEGFLEDDGSLIKEFIDVAQQTGINFIDLYMPNPQARSLLGEAFVNRREEFIIQGHLCSVWKDNQYKRTRQLDEVKAGFDDLLIRLQSTSIEIGMIHYVDAMKDLEEVLHGGIMEYVQTLKEQGKIKNVGLSSHNPLVALAAVETGLFDVLMFSINPCYDLQPANEDCNELWNDENYEQDQMEMDRSRQKLYEVCQEKGVGISVMKAFGGGDLLDEKLSPAHVALSVSQCIHYALTRPAVASVMVGSHSINELQDCLGYEEASDEEKDYAMTFMKMPKVNWEGHCMYCGHCAPCPKKIDVATLTKLLQLAKTQKEIPETVREHYAALSHQAHECMKCGACEQRCPFHVQVIKNMEEALERFGR